MQYLFENLAIFVTVAWFLLVHKRTAFFPKGGRLVMLIALVARFWCRRGVAKSVTQHVLGERPPGTCREHEDSMEVGSPGEAHATYNMTLSRQAEQGLKATLQPGGIRLNCPALIQGRVSH